MRDKPRFCGLLIRALSRGGRVVKVLWRLLLSAKPVVVWLLLLLKMGVVGTLFLRAECALSLELLRLLLSGLLLVGNLVVGRCRVTLFGGSLASVLGGEEYSRVLRRGVCVRTVCVVKGFVVLGGFQER